MQLDPLEIRTLAAMVCDYATIENCLAPYELDIAIKIAIAANFPQDSIEHLRRIHAQAVDDLGPSDSTYDEFGVNTKNSFNTAP